MFGDLNHQLPPFSYHFSKLNFYAVYESFLISEIPSLTPSYGMIRLHKRIFSSGLLTHGSAFLMAGWPGGLCGAAALFLDPMTRRFERGGKQLQLKSVCPFRSCGTIRS